MSPGLGGVAAEASERLRRVEAATDAALVHLDVESLLVDLLGRISEILRVDTAAVMLLDEETGELVTTATFGAAGGVRREVRIPVGRGFAGGIAARAAPAVIDDLDSADLLDPTLRAAGTLSVLGAPLISRGRVIGVIQVGTSSRRSFGPDDIEALQLVADRAATSVEVRRSGAERAAASMLQRSLIPLYPPRLPGLDMAARYLPADEGGVGGDWYDVFSLPSGCTGIVIGDVIGRGLASAVVMGRLRSALRAYALDEGEPHRVLERLDRKIQHFEAGQMTTVLYAVLAADLRSLSISSAGHPLPMMVRPGVAAVAVDAVTDPPLGIAPALSRRVSIVDLAPGTVLAFFTDGLVERRHEPLADGLARFAATLQAGPAEQNCAATVTALIGDTPLRDDAALLVVRREENGAGPMHLDAPAAPASLGRIRVGLRRWLAANDIGGDDAVTILLAAGEAAANAVEHAYGPSGGVVAVDVERREDAVLVTVRDTGSWRPPRGRNRGRGIGIMRRSTEDMTVESSDAGTEVRLRFRIGQADPS